ncbi:hypothetical protein [Flaviaesturariibacter aridisoli]|uniref:Uncharacterized protein n=1 Tax=Flaviaesturariibacter aridisoli TaxID=2545761 RepID=A0A4R4DSF7_9BACT|nr:hypothetical protein [Flaviaesturariibacter aridisoli]TCZ64581.1 hypothetical protein E0486_18160 [Flaviaesturariibacter aridisoli]
MGNLRLRSIESLYSPAPQVNTASLAGIITNYNTLKEEITAINTTNNGTEIHLNPAETTKFFEALDRVKRDLINILISS